MHAADAGPITSEEFAALMARFGPFENNPEIAVAVSGGADSMAAALLAHDWARALGGSVVAVTVDHGLRADSTQEAAVVARRLTDLGLKTFTLPWQGEKPASNQQALARRARYDLLSAWCANAGILHLVLGHHLEDQAETFLIRLARGSGLNGLSAMAPLLELPDHRLLRPLLSQPKSRLRATLENRGVTWVEDPSNRNPKYARTRFRDLGTVLAAQGLTAERLAETAGRLGRARIAAETEVFRILARAVSIHPAGFAFVDPRPVTAVSEELSLRCLARILATVSGRDYGPRQEPLEALHARISAGLTSGTTLSGCRLLPWRGSLIVCRENRDLPRIPLCPGRQTRWDNRFDVRVGAGWTGNEGELSFGPLGREGWAGIRQDLEPERWGVPPIAGAAVTAIRDARGVAAIPHLGYLRPGINPDLIEKCCFRSGISLTGVAFTVA